MQRTLSNTWIPYTIKRFFEEFLHIKSFVRISGKLSISKENPGTWGNNLLVQLTDFVEKITKLGYN